MPFPTCENGYNRRKLTDFAKGVVDDLKGIGKYFTPHNLYGYYVPPIIFDCAGSRAIFKNCLLVFPYPITIPINCIGAGFNVITPGGIDVEVGLYDSTDDDYPRNLLRNTLVSLSAGGVINVDWDPITLEPGLYWVGLVQYTEEVSPPSVEAFNRLWFLREFQIKEEVPAQGYSILLSSPGLPNPFPSQSDKDPEPSLPVFLRISQG